MKVLSDCDDMHSAFTPVQGLVGMDDGLSLHSCNACLGNLLIKATCARWGTNSFHILIHSAVVTLSAARIHLCGCRAHQQPFACERMHFRRLIFPWTDPSLGNCSYLDTCRHMKGCKHIHYELDDATTDTGGPTSAAACLCLFQDAMPKESATASLGIDSTVKQTSSFPGREKWIDRPIFEKRCGSRS